MKQEQNGIEKYRMKEESDEKNKITKRVTG